MPPAGQPRPDAAAYDSFRMWLEAELDRAAAATPNPGRKEPFHRLNRAEYQNAIRDLLAFDVDVTDDLPADDASYGFDDMAGVLRMSPTLMERYLVAADVPEDLPQDDRLDDLPFGTRGGAMPSPPRPGSVPRTIGFFINPPSATFQAIQAPPSSPCLAAPRRMKRSMV